LGFLDKGTQHAPLHALGSLVEIRIRTFKQVREGGFMVSERRERGCATGFLLGGQGSSKLPSMLIEVQYEPISPLETGPSRLEISPDREDPRLLRGVLSGDEWQGTVQVLLRLVESAFRDAQLTRREKGVGVWKNDSLLDRPETRRDEHHAHERDGQLPCVSPRNDTSSRKGEVGQLLESRQVVGFAQLLFLRRGGHP
jgi:hypothetical protein